MTWGNGATRRETVDGPHDGRPSLNVLSKRRDWTPHDQSGRQYHGRGLAVGANRAIWVAASRTAAHEAIVQPLAEPADGEPRIEADYSTTTPMADITDGMETAGCTEIYTLNHLTDDVPEPTW